MLDPELLDRLAAQPDKNAPEVNVALAEEGHGAVLLVLASSPAVRGDALDVVGQRISNDNLDPDEPEDDYEPIAPQIERALLTHANSSDVLRDTLLDRHQDDAFSVLAAGVHPRATLRAVERLALWPARFSVLDRLWISLVPVGALPPLEAEAWTQDPDPRKREFVARSHQDEALLMSLRQDEAREVRRALASNAALPAIREQLRQTDPAPEVRARAGGKLGHHDQLARADSPRFAAALRAMESGGVLAPDVAAALQRYDELDQEGAMLSAQVLEPDQVVDLVASAATAHSEAAVGVAAGLALRTTDDEESFRQLVVDAAKVLSSAADRFGALTGKARLAAWMAEGMAQVHSVGCDRLIGPLLDDPMAAEGAVLARAAKERPAMLTGLCEALHEGQQVPPALLELAWGCEALGDEHVVAMAKRMAKPKRRGKDLPDDELDLDPGRRSLAVLEQVTLSVARRAIISPRTALTVVAMDSRRVRYVLTAMPQWRGRLGGAMLGRVLRQHAGALSAARAEARSRGTDIRGWTERILSDIELAIALAIGHTTAELVVARFRSGRHQLEDGPGLAAGAEARANLEGSDAIAPLLRWSASQRGEDAAAFALWLLLEAHDRPRPAAMIGGAIDLLATRTGVIATSATEALAVAERRSPGRLETVQPHSPRGKATLASAIARAYRAVGGLRGET